MSYEIWHKNRVAVVTGGAVGIGRAIAEVLAQRGAQVAVGARRCADKRFADRINAETGCLAISLDVRDRISVETFFRTVHGALGTPDILVNAAGISVHQLISRHTDDAWDDVIDTNLNGCYRTIRACLPDMLEAGWGRIINIASTAAMTAVDTHGAYCASKAGLLGLTRAVALEGAPKGVTATCVSPTWVETEMLRQSAAEMAAAAGTSTAQEIAGLAQANPQNRLVQPSEIAHLVSFLCSDLSPGLTMEDIQVNAGAHW
jgi:NAD(P)-dependent dehydrogenase (short-subunit alcohol dehydrogenase family)